LLLPGPPRLRGLPRVFFFACIRTPQQQPNNAIFAGRSRVQASPPPSFLLDVPVCFVFPPLLHAFPNNNIQTRKPSLPVAAGFCVFSLPSGVPPSGLPRERFDRGGRRRGAYVRRPAHGARLFFWQRTARPLSSPLFAPYSHPSAPFQTVTACSSNQTAAPSPWPPPLSVCVCTYVPQNPNNILVRIPFFFPTRTGAGGSIVNGASYDRGGFFEQRARVHTALQKASFPRHRFEKFLDAPHIPTSQQHATPPPAVPPLSPSCVFLLLPCILRAAPLPPGARWCFLFASLSHRLKQHTKLRCAARLVLFGPQLCSAIARPPRPHAPHVTAGGKHPPPFSMSLSTSVVLLCNYDPLFLYKGALCNANQYDDGGLRTPLPGWRA
jgi:hypothetical protein